MKGRVYGRAKWLWWVLGLLALLVVLYYTALPGDLAVGRDDAAGLSGIYTVNGVDPTGAEYSGTVVIRATGTAGRYDIEWIITGTVQKGTGQRQGDRLDVSWKAVASALGPVEGTGRYDIAPDGRMTGTWTVVGTDQTGTEEIFPEA